MEQGLIEGNFEQEILDGILDYIHGPAKEQIIQAVQGGEQDLGQTIAALAYRIVRETADQFEGGNPEILDIDFLLYLATETIDDLLEIVEALGIQHEADAIRQESLISMVAMHMEAVGDDPEQKAMAQEALSQMMEDGSYAQAMSDAEQMMRQRGIDPAQAAAAGEQMAAPRPNQVSQAVGRGLLGA